MTATEVAPEVDDDGGLLAESPHVEERLITAPHAGVFHPYLTELPITDVGRVLAGEAIGVLVRSGEKTMVESPFEGIFRGLLVLPGERVRPNQPVAWISL
jgi:biotin carboxyl carrier protein